MKDLQMPHSYAMIPENEQGAISGGGPLGDALNEFFGSFQLDDLFFGGGLISFSFTFVPMLLFNVVRTGVDVVLDAYDSLSHLFGFSQESDEVAHYLIERKNSRAADQQPTV